MLVQDCFSDVSDITTILVQHPDPPSAHFILELGARTSDGRLYATGTTLSVALPRLALLQLIALPKVPSEVLVTSCYATSDDEATHKSCSKL